LALARAEPLARALARSTLIYLAVAGPLIRLFDGSAERLLRAVGVEPVQELHGGATLEELGDIIGKSHSAGHLPADLSGLLDRALSFGDLTADAVMVPRPQVRTLPGSAPVSELVALIRETGHSAYPVSGEDVAEELVGEIADETDAREDAPTSGPDGSWIVDAGMRIDEVGRLTRFDLPEGDAYDTLGGLVMAELRRLPSPGDRLTVELDTGSVELEVLSVARRVADKILIKAPSPVEVAGPPVVPAPSRADVPAPAGDVAAPSAGQDAAAPGQEVSWTR